MQLVRRGDAAGGDAVGGNGAGSDGASDNGAEQSVGRRDRRPGDAMEARRSPTGSRERVYSLERPHTRWLYNPPRNRRPLTSWSSKLGLGWAGERALKKA